MSLVNGAVDSLLDGVSQEPPVQRLPSQAQEQINWWSSAAYGLVKRPPTTLVKQLVSASPPTAYADALTHTIRRGPADVHKVIIKNGAIEVYDALTGNATTLTTSDLAYLNTPNPAQDIRCITIGDSTFILNRTINPLRTTARSPQVVQRQALIVIKSVDYSTTYSVELAKIGGGLFSSLDPTALFDAPAFVNYTTPAGDTAAARALIGTDFVAQQLYNKLLIATFPDTGALLTTVYKFSLINSTIVVYRTIDNYDFAIAVTDGLGDTAIVCIKNQVTSAAQLPAAAPDGFLIQVVPDPTTPYGVYWVQYNSQQTAQGSGVWQETIGPNVALGFDISTMPHVLSEQPVRSYYFRDGGVSPVINVQNGYSTVQLEQWVGLGQNQNLVVSVQDGNGTAIFSNTAGFLQKDCLVSCTFDLDTTALAATDSVTVFLEKETAPASGVYTVVSSRIFLPAAGKFLNEVISGFINATNSTTYHARLRLHYNNSGGGTATLTGHSRYQDGGPGFSYKMVLGALVSTTYDVWPISQGGDANSSITLSFDVAGTGNIYLAVWFQIDDTKAKDGLNALINGGPLLPDGGLVEEANEVGGFNIVATPVAGSDRAWMITWQNPAANALAPVITATRTLANSATGVGTGKVTLFDPNFTGIPAGYMNTAITNIRTGDVINLDAQNLRSIHLPAGYAHPVAIGDIYKVSTIASFAFGAAPWANRLVGDEITNPMPSIENRPIMDLFQTQGRLGFVSDNNVVMSCSDNVFGLFRHTATELVTSDVIDVSAASQKPAFFHSAVEWDYHTYLFTDLQVFELNPGGGLLTPASVAIRMVLDVESSRNIRPFTSGRRLFLARSRATAANLSQIIELAHQPSGDGLVFNNITKHLPTYLSGAPIFLSGDDASGALFLLTDAGNFYPNFYGVAETKTALQETSRPVNSWSTWVFPGATVIGADMFNGVLSLITTRSDGVYLETMDLTQAPGDATVHQDIGAVPYSVQYTLSTIYPRKVMRDYTVKVDRLANLQMRFLYLRYEATRSFTISAANPGRATYTSVFLNAVGQSGLYHFSVMGTNTDLTINITDTSDFPLRLSGFDWEATYSTRSQRL